MDGYLEIYFRGKKENIQKVVDYTKTKSVFVARKNPFVDTTNESETKVLYQSILNLNVLESKDNIIELFISTGYRIENVKELIHELVSIESTLKVKGYSYYAKYSYYEFYSRAGIDALTELKDYYKVYDDIEVDYECDGDWWEVDTYKYELKKDNTIKINKYCDWYEEVAIPESIDGYTVTEIDNEIFYDKYKKYITKLTIPNCVTKIGKDAFEDCDKLVIYCDEGSCAEITAKESRVFSTTTNSKGKFKKPTYIYSINDNKVKIHGYRGKESEVIIPTEIESKEVTCIGDKAFFENKKITKVIFPDSVINIGNEVFKKCENLKEVILPKGLTKISSGMFTSTKIEKIDLPKNIKSIENSAFENCFNLDEIALPISVTHIGSNTFKYCNNLKRIILPENIKELGFDVFACTSIDEIEISKSVESIGSLGNIDKIILDKDNKNFVAKDNILYSKDKKVMIQPLEQCKLEDATNYHEIEDVVEVIGKSILPTNIKKLSIPYSLREIKSIVYVDEIVIRNCPIEDKFIDITLDLNVTSKFNEFSIDCMETNKNNTFFDFESYDDLFNSCLRNLKDKLPIAINRLKYPVQLTQDKKDMYTQYITKNEKKIISFLVENNDIDSIIFLEELIDTFKLKNLENAIELSRTLGHAKITAYLVDYKNNKFNIS